MFIASVLGAYDRPQSQVSESLCMWFASGMKQSTKDYHLAKIQVLSGKEQEFTMKSPTVGLERRDSGSATCLREILELG